MNEQRRFKEVIKRVHELFKNKNLTLSVAESCTGGLICHHITSLSGASNFFEAGVIPYSAEAKRNILGIIPDVISKYGVVSEETARKMAERIRSLTGTDFSLSTTGNLGPDVLEGKERGLVYVAVSNKDQTVFKELRLTGNRMENKEEASISALKLLVEVVEKGFYA